MWRIEDFSQEDEHERRAESSWGRYICGGPKTQVETCVQQEGHSDPQSTFWTECEPARVIKCNSQSFAMDARIRLENLKSGCSLPSHWCAIGSTCEKESAEQENLQNDQTALDLVEILDLDENVQDEERWLYEPQNKRLYLEVEPAVRWCRRVLDNPSPEMEAARRLLMMRLDKRSKYHFQRCGELSHHYTTDSVSSSGDRISICDTDKAAISYRLQDITDVHIMAKIQEDSLRQHYVSMPASRRTPDSTAEFSPGTKRWASPSSHNEPDSPSFRSAHCSTTAAPQKCESPKMSPLHQQVTQFKLMRLAQNQAFPNKSRSPLQTSLRSLQAVRNSRSLETDDHQPAGPPSYHPTGISSSRARSQSPAKTINSCSSTPLMKDSSDRITAMKRLHRSQSLSPSRIARPAKGYLCFQGRIFASPERPTTAAWGGQIQH